MPLQPRITALAQAVGSDIKALTTALAGKADKGTTTFTTTLPALSTLASTSSLTVGSIYHLTDTAQIAIATSNSTYNLWNRAGEQGFVVTATAPVSPYVGQVWLQLP